MPVPSKTPSNPSSEIAASTVTEGRHASPGTISTAGIVPLTHADGFVSVVQLSDGYGLLPITMSVALVGSWTGLKKTKIQELINTGAIATSKVDGRTLCLTNSVIALIDRHRVQRGG